MNLSKISYELGKQAERLETIHSCSNLQYPFLPNINCDACCHFVSRFIERENLKTDFLKFGWNHIVSKMDEKFTEMDNLAEGRRNVGANI